MKKLSVIAFISLLLTFSVTAHVLGMVAYFTGEPDDLWYTVTPENPHLQINSSDIPSFSGEFYQNEQTFLNITYTDDYQALIPNNPDTPPTYVSSEATTINAAYLFKNGVFLGFHQLELSKDHPMLEKTTLSAGYRYKFGTHSYLAFSMDYEADDFTSEILGYELNLRHYTPKMKLSADIFKDDEHHEKVKYTDYMFGQINYQLTDGLVCGFNFARIEHIQKNIYPYGCGMTWNRYPFIINLQLFINGRIDYTPDKDHPITKTSDIYRFNGIYHINDQAGLGFTTVKDTALDDLKNTLIVKHNFFKGSLRLEYDLKNDSYPEKYALTYYQKR